jgi:hypothetical protein
MLEVRIVGTPIADEAVVAGTVDARAAALDVVATALDVAAAVEATALVGHAAFD